MTNIYRASLLLIALNDMVRITWSDASEQKSKNFYSLLVNLEEGREVTFANDVTNSDTTSAEDTCNITTIISKSSGQIKSVNYPEPYPTNCEWTYFICVGSGHKIGIKVVDLDLDTDNGDKLSMEPLSSKEKNTQVNNLDLFRREYSEVSTVTDTTTVTTKKPTTTVRVEETFEVNSPCCDSAIIKFTVGNHTNNHTGFLLLYERIEERTPAIWPLSNLLGWHQVYLCGTTVEEFSQHLNDFRNSLVGTVEKYCKEHNIIAENGKISPNQILINMLVPCPSSWPSSSNCLQLNYSIKVDSINGAIEMTTEHLEEMWNEYRDTDELTDLGLWEYDIPNVQWLFWFWIGLLCFLSLFFCLLLIIIVKMKLIYYYFLRLKFTGPQEMSNFIRWQEADMMASIFTAENAQRLRFFREYEKLNTTRPSRSCPNVTIEGEDGTSKTVVYDEISEQDEQHIYQTLTSPFAKSTDEENILPSNAQTNTKSQEENI